MRTTKKLRACFRFKRIQPFRQRVLCIRMVQGCQGDVMVAEDLAEGVRAVRQAPVDRPGFFQVMKWLNSSEKT